MRKCEQSKALLESIQTNLNEKINKDNIEINKAIANANRGTKNAEAVKSAGYEVDKDYGSTVVRNPNTNKSVEIGYDITKENKDKVDWKGKLDSTRQPYGRTHASYRDGFDGKSVPKSKTITKNKYGTPIYDREEGAEYYDGISQNIKNYKQVVKDKEDAEHSVKLSQDSMNYYEKKVADAQKDLDFHKKYMQGREEDIVKAEAKRKSIIDKARERRAAKANESEEPLTEASFFNLYKSFDSLYGISKYSPEELRRFMNSLKEGNRISDKDYEVMMNYANAHEELINTTGYESTERLEEDYSERIGGDPEDFIVDLRNILRELKTIETDNLATGLAKQVVYGFEETVESQIRMTVNKYDLTDIYNEDGTRKE